MNIAILAVGSIGDIRPSSLLGAELQRRGHSVTVIGFDNLRYIAEAEGLRYVDFPINASEFMSAVAQVEGYGFNTVSGLIRCYKQGAEEIKRVLMEETKSADLIIFVMYSSAMATIPAEYLNKPYIRVSLWPDAQTTEFPPTSFLKWPVKSLRGLYNKITHKIAFQLSTMVTLKVFYSWTKELKMPRCFRYGVTRLDRRPIPNLFAYSSTFIPTPSDYPSNVNVTGYWLREREKAEEYTPEPSLVKFLAAGEAPIYIGFGSVPGKLTKIWTTVKQALEKSGRRAIINSGWSGMDEMNFGDNVYVIKFVPHDWLFSRCSAIIHHGGAGTTAEALRAGKPSLVVPFVSDQNFWGDYIAKSGCGLSPIPFKKLTVDNLCEAMNNLELDGIKTKAMRFSEIINSENGVGNACDFIESYAEEFNPVAEKVAIPVI